MRPRLWECVERQPGLHASLLEWQRILGEDYARVERYFRPTDRRVTHMPCRVSCRQWCRRRVVRHGPGHVVAICDEGDPKYAVDETDLISYELNLGAVCRDLCSALAIEPAVDNVVELHQTWQCGFVRSLQGISHPVYLSIQMEDQHMMEVGLKLAAMNRTPMILLLPTTRRMSGLVRHVLAANQTAWTPLNQTVDWSPEGRMITDLNLAEMLAPADPKESFRSAEPVRKDVGDKITIERQEMDDGVHWIVNGEDKGVFYHRNDTKQAFILGRLYEQIGYAWVKHPIFIKNLGWSEANYFGLSGKPKLMQNQLYHIRRFLGVKIEFHKDKGVRFAESVVRLT